MRCSTNTWTSTCVAEPLDEQDQRVDLTPQPINLGGITIIPQENGDQVIDLGGDAGEEAGPLGLGDADHDENLAEVLDETTLNKMAMDVISWVDADIESRQEWNDRFKKGLEKLGLLKPSKDAGSMFLENQSAVIHPLILESAVQFQARALEEMFPAAGPVKRYIPGEATKELEDQGDRVTDYMNWQVIEQDKGYFWDVDQMLFYLPFGGSAFKKTWRDEDKRMVLGRFIKSEDMIVPYEATRHETPRMTHRIRMSHNRFKRYQAVGYYRDDITLRPSTQGHEETLADLADQRTPTHPSNYEGDHEILECHCEVVVSLDQPDGVDRGKEIAYPYIVSVDRDNNRTVSVYRNWKEADEQKQARMWFTKYDYLPGLGYYGFGLFHAIGGLGEAATEALRAFLDSASAANFQGGFKSVDAAPKGKSSGEMRLKWGVYQDVDLTAEELKNAFFNPPFHQPSPAMPEVLKIIIEAGQRFGSITEAMVGEGGNNVPVGTTVARIEQASKVYSGIHRRLHKSAGEEFELRFELNGEHIPPEGYPYKTKGASKQVFAEDFAGKVGVVPVSDPNIFSSTQRIALAQTGLQLAQSAPGLYDMREAHVRMLRALKTPDIDTLMPDPDTIPARDPVTEGQIIMVGKPVKVFPWQEDDAHNAVHMGQAQMWSGSPQAQQIMPALMAHIAEHEAQKYRKMMMQQLGIPLPDPKDPKFKPLPPEIENKIAMMAAQFMQHLQQQLAQQQQPDPKAVEGQADTARKDAAAKAEIARKDALAQADTARRNAAHDGDQTRANTAQLQQHAVDAQAAQVEKAQAFLEQNGVQGIQPLVLVEAVHDLKLDLQSTLELLMRIRAGGQDQGLTPPVLRQ